MVMRKISVYGSLSPAYQLLSGLPHSALRYFTARVTFTMNG